MRILVVGAIGLVGSAVVAALRDRHEVIRAGRNGPLQIDLESQQDLSAALAKAGPPDAVVCCAGRQSLGPVEELTASDVNLCLTSKLGGQVRLAIAAAGTLGERGSITLTSGAFARIAIPGTSTGAMVNAGLEVFVRTAAIDLAPRLRINTVSPAAVVASESELAEESPYAITADAVARTYLAAIEGEMTGMALDPAADV